MGKNVKTLLCNCETLVMKDMRSISQQMYSVHDVNKMNTGMIA